LVVPKGSWESLLDEITKKLKAIKPVHKLYTDTGKELKNIDELESGMKVIAVAQNEKFKAPVSEGSGKVASKLETKADSTDENKTEEAKPDSEHKQDAKIEAKPHTAPKPAGIIG
jgi:hypothetical protein